MPDPVPAEATADNENRHNRRTRAAAARPNVGAAMDGDENLGFYSKAQVCRLTTLNSTTLWRRIRAGDFPRGVKLSPNRVGWPKQAVHDWIARKTNEAESVARGSAAARSATETSR